MRVGIWAGLALLAIGTPAVAERLTFDHRYHPGLQVVLDSGRSEMVTASAACWGRRW